ncbi:ROK family transcriptional regulator [Caulobacter segnis]|uniref:ROK family transcriptional regulator n=1 Tax=Caulobacter segnis TaxID=88688 RepID=UPI00240FCF60|nr:ROK family transcriptional regulator [Caulobacter segnis]MDG2520673.1 ROK family transcriptional regulator [Caulobacter segnis]
MSLIPRSAAALDSLSGTNLERAGEHNQRVILQAIRSAGSITRSDLTAITGLTAPTVSNITNRLLSDGFIKKAGKTEGGRGQPATKFVIDADSAYALGLNIDRDHTTLVLMDFIGQVKDRVCVEGHFALPDAVLSFVQNQLARLRSEGRIDLSRLAGIGIGIPDDLGRIPLPNKPAAYEAWSQIDVCGFFSDALGLPACMENDATAAAIGELHFGSGAPHQNFIFTLISAGLGSGLIIGGQPYRGSDNRSGEIAFVSRDLMAAAKGGGILQDEVSLYALYAFMGKRGLAVSTPEDVNLEDPEHVAALRAWADHAADELLGTVAIINCVLNPAVHFIGGRLPKLVAEHVCDRLNARIGEALPRVPKIAPFKPATAAEDAAPMGAAMLLFQNRFLLNPEALMKTQAS